MEENETQIEEREKEREREKDKEKRENFYSKSEKWFRAKDSIQI